jgi:hypothetical protein
MKPVQLPLANARRWWLSALIAALPVFFFMLTPRSAPPIVALLYALSIVLIALDWLPHLVMRYDYNPAEDAITVRVFGREHRLEQVSKRGEITTASPSLRTFGLGLGGLNYGWYQLEDRRCFVVETGLQGEKLMIPREDHWFVITPDMTAWRQTV